MSCELELFRSSFGRLMWSWVCCSGPAGLWNFHQLHLYISKLCVRFCWSLHCNSIDWFSVTATCSFLNYPANCVLISNVFSSTLLIVWFIFLFLNGMAACLVHWCVCVCASFLCRYHALTLMYDSSLFYIVKLQISGYLYMWDSRDWNGVIGLLQG